MLNEELIDPKEKIIGVLKEKIFQLNKTIKEFKAYDEKRKKYYSELATKIGELESYIEELESKHGIVHLREKLRKAKEENKALQAKIILHNRFEDIADITAIVALDKDNLINQIKEKSKKIQMLIEGRNKMLSRIAYLEKQLNGDIEKDIFSNLID